MKQEKKLEMELVIFDLDGTLADTIPGLCESVRHVAALHGVREVPEDLVRYSVGNGAAKLVERVYAKLGLSGFAEDVPIFREHYAAQGVRESQLYPQTMHVLQTLRAQGVHCCIATMKPRSATDALLDALELRPWVDLIFAAEDMPPKPNPWYVQACAQQLHIPLSRTMVVGDGVTDVRAAQAAGVVSVAVLGGYCDQAALHACAADYEIEQIGEILALIKGVNI